MPRPVPAHAASGADTAGGLRRDSRPDGASLLAREMPMARRVRPVPDAGGPTLRQVRAPPTAWNGSHTTSVAADAPGSSPGALPDGKPVVRRRREWVCRGSFRSMPTGTVPPGAGTASVTVTRPGSIPSQSIPVRGSIAFAWWCRVVQASGTVEDGRVRLATVPIACVPSARTSVSRPCVPMGNGVWGSDPRSRGTGVGCAASAPMGSGTLGDGRASHPAGAPTAQCVIPALRVWDGATRTTVGAGTGQPRGLHRTDDGTGRVVIGEGCHRDHRYDHHRPASFPVAIRVR
jgi:hypothetical protein